MKKGKKKDRSDSSSSESTEEEDKKSVSSDSSEDKSAKSKEKAKKNKSSSDYESESRRKRSKIADEEKICAKRREIEHSKWDSPSDKTDRKSRKSDSRRFESKEKVGTREDRKTKRHDDHEGDNKDNKSSSYRRREDYSRQRDERRDKYKNDRRDDRVDNHNRGRDRSRSRSRDRNSRRNNDFRNRRRQRSRSGSFDHSKANWGKSDQKSSGANDKKEKEKPNFGLSGKLTEETNTFKGVVIKYSEPPEARKPKRRWRLYPFKGEKAMQTLFIHRESAYLIGRDRKVVDLPVDHPSCSKQHAALQYRLVPFTREDGSSGKRVRPYLIDLESANGTYINNKKIEPKKYVELLERDVIKFGYSSREYVLLHENSKDEAMDDDVKNEEEEVVKKEPKE